MDLIKSRDFREHLKRELKTRSARNVRYSLRAFSKHLEIDSSRLSKILKGLRPINANLIESMGQKLGLDEMQILEFKKGTLQPYQKSSQRSSALVVASNPARAQAAILTLRKLAQEIALFLEDTDDKSHIYHLDIELMEISKVESPNTELVTTSEPTDPTK